MDVASVCLASCSSLIRIRLKMINLCAAVTGSSGWTSCLIIKKIEQAEQASMASAFALCWNLLNSCCLGRELKEDWRLIIHELKNIYNLMICECVWRTYLKS